MTLSDYVMLVIQKEGISYQAIAAQTAAELEEYRKKKAG